MTINFFLSFCTEAQKERVGRDAEERLVVVPHQQIHNRDGDVD